MACLLLWIGGALILTPLCLFLLPYFTVLLRGIYYAHDDLELTTFRRQWIPILASMLLLVPDILMLKCEDETDLTLLWKIGAIYLYILLPTLVCMFRPDAKLPMDSFDILTIALIAGPLIVNYYTSFLPDVFVKLKEHWPRISMLDLTGVNVGLCIFNGFRPLKDFGYTLAWSLSDFLRLIVGLALSAMIFLPICYGANLFEKSSQERFDTGLAHFLTYFLVVSIPQEILFRGVIQNLLHSRLESSADVSVYVSDSNRSDALNMVEWPNYRTVAQKEEKEEADIEKDQFSYEQIHHRFFSRGICCWLSLPTFRDWIALIIASLIYAATVMDHRKWDSEGGKQFSLIFILGMICGYTWRQTSKVTISAILSSIVMYLGLNVLQVNLDSTL